MNTFPVMRKLLPPKTVGIATIRHARVSKFEAMMSSMRGVPTDPGTFAVLEVNGRVMMSDTYHEHQSNYRVVHEAHGDVFIAGLGMGMVLHPILNKAEVRAVTVVEKYQDVIDLIVPTLPHRDKLTVICADIFTFNPSKRAEWDTIYFDIWADICTDNLPEIASLHQRFKSRKAEGGWMNSWLAEDLRYRKRRGQ